jgi:hypothetical protein
MPLSTLPTTGPTIPAGANSVSLKEIDVASTAKKEDVTTLSSEEREYADPPLIEAGDTTATATCSASGFVMSTTTIAPTAIETTTGWICEDCEFVYEAGKYATWSANWSYYPEEA